MSITKFPPEGIIMPMKINKDFEYIILWMLYNNDYCTWSDFKSKPVNISPATLSKYLNILINNEFIEKEKKGEYKITSEGRRQYTDLQVKGSLETSLNYPPDVITKVREYDHWILWMLYNNAYCKWGDFIESPLSINQSSLSKNLNLLLDKDFVEKNNREYRITRDGETEYFKILKKYDLDRQSILDEESKRVEVITDKVGKFFKEYDIEDDEIRYRFLNMVLRLDYTKVEATLSDEVDFDKILLFLSINNPDNYPNYIKAKDFALEYDIKLTTLNFFVEKIVEDKLYAIKFFKLDVKNKFTYYIQAEERLEKTLSVIIEDYIRKFTYLSKFQKKNGDQYQTPDINQLLDDVLEDLCSNLFHEDLKPSLRKFLIEYIEHLAYKFETEKSLINHTDKIKGIAFQNVFEVIQSFDTTDTANATSKPVDNESYYFLHNRIFDTLDLLYLSKIDFIRLSEFKEEYFPKNKELITKIEGKFAKGKLSKVNELLTNNLTNLNELELMIMKDLIYTYSSELEDSIELTTEIIEKYPNEYVGYLFQSITYFLMGKFKNALEIIDLGLNMSFDVSLICQKAQVLINYDHSKSLEVIEDVIGDHPNNLLLLRTKFLSIMTDKLCCEKSIEIPTDLIDSLLALDPKNFELVVLKAVFFIVIHKYKEAKDWIKQNIDFNLLKHNPRVDAAAYLVLAYSYLARGKFEKALEIVQKVKFHYPNHPLSHIIPGMVHGFNIVYNFDASKANKELFREEFQKAIAMEQSEKNLSRYYQLESYILNETDGIEEALIAINKAIELSPEHFDIYGTKSHLYLSHKDRSEEVLELFEELQEKFPQENKDIHKMTSFAYFAMGNTTEGIKILEEGLKLFPEATGMLNNKAIFLSNLERFDEAVKSIEKAIELDPLDANLYDTYGEVLMDSQNYEAAIVKFTQSLEMSPNGWFTFHTFLKLSKCYKSLGELEKATVCFDKAKILTEKVIPGKKNMYLDQLDESVKELNKIPL
jgi:tetratricopeptide (TPR) repeat protein/Mn-dependent DtxR family transcriptional regulator